MRLAPVVSTSRFVWPGALLAPAAFGLSALLFFHDPAETPWLPRCPTHLLTGLHCPGCGATRAVHALLHCDVSAALSMNALFVCGAPPASVAWLWHEFSKCRRPSSHRKPLPARWIWAGVCVALAFMILRNIPTHPFILLAPH